MPTSEHPKARFRKRALLSDGASVLAIVTVMLFTGVLWFLTSELEVQQGSTYGISDAFTIARGYHRALARTVRQRVWTLTRPFDATYEVVGSTPADTHGVSQRVLPRVPASIVPPYQPSGPRLARKGMPTPWPSRQSAADQSSAVPHTPLEAKAAPPVARPTLVTVPVPGKTNLNTSSSKAPAATHARMTASQKDGAALAMGSTSSLTPQDVGTSPANPAGAALQALSQGTAKGADPPTASLLPAAPVQSVAVVSVGISSILPHPSFIRFHGIRSLRRKLPPDPPLPPLLPHAMVAASGGETGASSMAGKSPWAGSSSKVATAENVDAVMLADLETLITEEGAPGHAHSHTGEGDRLTAKGGAPKGGHQGVQLDKREGHVREKDHQEDGGVDDDIEVSDGGRNAGGATVEGDDFPDAHISDDDGPHEILERKNPHGSPPTDGKDRKTAPGTHVPSTGIGRPSSPPSKIGSPDAPSVAKRGSSKSPPSPSPGGNPLPGESFHLGDKIEALLREPLDVVLNRLLFEMNGSVSCGRHQIMAFRDYQELLETEPGLLEVIPDRDVLGPLVPPEESSRPLGACAVVGNSGQLLERAYGEEIDAHDTVIRFNAAPTKGFEKGVGTKTSIRIQNVDNLGWREGKQDKLLVFTARDKKDVKKFVVHRKKYPTRPQYVFNPEWWCHIWNWVEHRKLKPSTGMAGVVLAIRLCRSVDLYGFSHNATEFHYYNHLPEKVTHEEVYKYHPLVEEASVYGDLQALGHLKIHN